MYVQAYNTAIPLPAWSPIYHCGAMGVGELLSVNLFGLLRDDVAGITDLF